MRRLWIVLLALAMVTLAATPATGGKGGIPGPPDDKGKPEPEPYPPSVTCSYPIPYWEPGVKSEDFFFTVSADSPDACFDVIPTGDPSKWEVTVTLVGGVWKKPFLALLPRDAAYPSDSCGGEIRRGEEVYDAAYQPWVLPPADDERGFTVIPAATVNACPGWDAESVGGAGNGEFPERVQYLNNGETNELVYNFPDATVEDPLAFVVWSQGARKDTYVVRIEVDLPPLDSDS